MTNHLIELCRGRVMHARLRPFVHRFVYRVFCLRLRVDQLTKLSTCNSWLFGIDKKRIVSFQSRDHGLRDGSDLMMWLTNTLSVCGVTFQIGAVWLQCFPRVFGYVFNPVSFWFVHDQQGMLRVLVAEVNNTFGQRHQYVLTALGLAEIKEETVLECQKIFHVSPFCDVEGVYRFKSSRRAEQTRMAIDYFDAPDNPEPLLKTAIVTQSQAFSNAALFACLVTMPIMTFGVMMRIHWQAFKLWRQGARYHPVPPQPKDEVSNNRKVSS